MDLTQKHPIYHRIGLLLVLFLIISLISVGAASPPSKPVHNPRDPNKRLHAATRPKPNLNVFDMITFKYTCTHEK